MADWMVRALKTFVQAFLGVLIPEICAALNGFDFGNINKNFVVLMPVITAALAAGISAAWNIVLEHMKEE